jgi:hypothetical protein
MQRGPLRGKLQGVEQALLRSASVPAAGPTAPQSIGDAGYLGAPCPLLLSPESSAHDGVGHCRKL